MTADGRESYATQSVSAVLLMIFQYSEDMGMQIIYRGKCGRVTCSVNIVQHIFISLVSAHHCQMLECLMTMKQSLVKDMLCVIAHGTSTARASAAKLLFYYWPTFNSSLFERKGVPPKFSS